MTQTLVAPTPVSAALRTLTAQDRCDRCGAQAYTRFANVDLDFEGRPAEFTFCAHHTIARGPKGVTHKDALIAQGFALVGDETHRLDEGNRQQGEDHA